MAQREVYSSIASLEQLVMSPVMGGDSRDVEGDKVTKAIRIVRDQTHFYEDETRLPPLLLRSRIPSREKEILKQNGVTVYMLEGLCIREQIAIRRKAGRPTFWYLLYNTEKGNIPVLPARRIEIGIFPDPGEFFVPDSFDKDTATQEILAEADARTLSTRLGIRGITQIIPRETSALTELVFQHLKATGHWLFGSEYAAAQGMRYVAGRTKDPTLRDDSLVAYVGDARPEDGLYVNSWFRRQGLKNVGAPRLLIATIGR